MGTDISVPLLEDDNAPRPVRYGAGTIAVDVCVSQARRQDAGARAAGRADAGAGAALRVPAAASPSRRRAAAGGGAAGTADLRTVAGALLALQRPACVTRGAATAFDCAKAPRVSLRNYLHRLVDLAGPSPECVALALVYVNRYLSRTGTPAHIRNTHRLALTAFVLACKGRDDIFYSNAYYAEVGGVPMRELNKMEVAMLTALDWDLYVSPEELAESLALAADPPPPSSSGVDRGSSVSSSVQSVPTRRRGGGSAGRWGDDDIVWAPRPGSRA